MIKINQSLSGMRHAYNFYAMSWKKFEHLHNDLHKDLRWSADGQASVLPFGDEGGDTTLDE